ncbi:hypothetical protein [Dactylosporangium sp. CA-139066]|uniref:hypothetical protein n=1 Tax=Dactylosporangium sp. CA-139066 TaxID=3239930 RepID=UPI003D8A01CF
MTAVYERTGDLAALLPSRAACERGSTTVHAAEDTIAHHDSFGGWDHHYPELTSLCGERGWGEAGAGSRFAGQVMDLSHVNCPRCRRTTRFREATR